MNKVTANSGENKDMKRAACLRCGDYLVGRGAKCAKCRLIVPAEAFESRDALSARLALEGNFFGALLIALGLADLLLSGSSVVEQAPLRTVAALIAIVIIYRIIRFFETFWLLLWNRFYFWPVSIWVSAVFICAVPAISPSSEFTTALQRQLYVTSVLSWSLSLLITGIGSTMLLVLCQRSIRGIK